MDSRLDKQKNTVIQMNVIESGLYLNIWRYLLRNTKDPRMEIFYRFQGSMENLIS